MELLYSLIQRFNHIVLPSIEEFIYQYDAKINVVKEKMQKELMQVIKESLRENKVIDEVLDSDEEEDEEQKAARIKEYNQYKFER